MEEINYKEILGGVEQGDAGQMFHVDDGKSQNALYVLKINNCKLQTQPWLLCRDAQRCGTYMEVISQHVSAGKS